MNTNTASAYFSPPRMARPLGPLQRMAMLFDYEKIYVILCGGFPTLSAYLCFQKDVEVYHVDNTEELREVLDDRNGVPADLVMIYDYDKKDRPPTTRYSVVDGHAYTMKFALDPFIDDESRLNEICVLIDSLRTKKEQFVKGFGSYLKQYPEL